MELTISINGVEKKLEIEKQGELYRFAIEDKDYRVRVEPLSNGSLAFFVGNSSYVAYLTIGADGTRIAIGGKNYLVAEETDNGNQHGGAHASTHSDGRVESPMPGNIIAVHVNEGDLVESGQAVVVIESMKMQNEITSPVDGQVAKVNCAVGDQVDFGHVLVEVTPKK